MPDLVRDSCQRDAGPVEQGGGCPAETLRCGRMRRQMVAGRVTTSLSRQESAPWHRR